MIVEIIKSSKSTYWYSKEIGNSFEVEFLLAENPLNILRFLICFQYQNILKLAIVNF